MNPLLEKFTNSYETVPFSKIKSAHFKPAFQKAIEEGKAEVAAIVDNSETPSFENTTVALENSGKLLDRSLKYFLQSKRCRNKQNIATNRPRSLPLVVRIFQRHPAQRTLV